MRANNHTYYTMYTYSMYSVRMHGIYKCKATKHSSILFCFEKEAKENSERAVKNPGKIKKKFIKEAASGSKEKEKQ